MFSNHKIKISSLIGIILMAPLFLMAACTGGGKMQVDCGSPVANNFSKSLGHCPSEAEMAALPADPAAGEAATETGAPPANDPVASPPVITATTQMCTPTVINQEPTPTDLNEPKCSEAFLDTRHKLAAQIPADIDGLLFYRYDPKNPAYIMLNDMIGDQINLEDVFKKLGYLPEGMQIALIGRVEKPVETAKVRDKKMETRTAKTVEATPPTEAPTEEHKLESATSSTTPEISKGIIIQVTTPMSAANFKTLTEKFIANKEVDFGFGPFTPGRVMPSKDGSSLSVQVQDELIIMTTDSIAIVDYTLNQSILDTKEDSKLSFLTAPEGPRFVDNCDYEINGLVRASGASRIMLEKSDLERLIILATKAGKASETKSPEKVRKGEKVADSSLIDDLTEYTDMFSGDPTINKVYLEFALTSYNIKKDENSNKMWGDSLKQVSFALWNDEAKMASLSVAVTDKMLKLGALGYKMHDIINQGSVENNMEQRVQGEAPATEEPSKEAENQMKPEETTPHTEAVATPAATTEEIAAETAAAVPAEENSVTVTTE